MLSSITSALRKIRGYLADPFQTLKVQILSISMVDFLTRISSWELDQLLDRFQLAKT